jgi:vancomycin permeability regulator SanA
MINTDMTQKRTDTFKKFCLGHKRLLLALMALTVIAPIMLVVFCHNLINTDSQYILRSDSRHHEHVGIVLGAGITKDNKPFKELQARLDVAAKALKDGQVDKLLLSGDNRVKNYNEPDAMVNYLVNGKHIARDKLQPDYAGRSTYESCERASKVFGLKKAIIISAPTHLPRAIYLCRHFGVEAYGLSSGVDANNAQRRELQANVKALFNMYIHGENTILGPPVKM